MAVLKKILWFVISLVSIVCIVGLTENFKRNVKAAHNHVWVEQKETIHHEEQGHYEEVYNDWSEEFYIRNDHYKGWDVNKVPADNPIWEKENGRNYSIRSVDFLNYLGYSNDDIYNILVNATQIESGEPCLMKNKLFKNKHLLFLDYDELEEYFKTRIGGYEGYYGDYVLIHTENHHDFVESKWVVDKAAYDEEVVTGYKCSCGATKPLNNVVNVDVKNGTKGDIKTSLTSGIYSGKVNFTVTSSEVCRVYYTVDDGETYTRLNKVSSSGNTHSFSVTVNESMTVVIAKVGDVNLDGDVDSADALQILRFDVDKVKFNTLQKLIGDVTGDTKNNSADALQILRYDVDKTKFDW